MRVWLASASSRRCKWLSENLKGVHCESLDHVEETGITGPVKFQVTTICQKKANAVPKNNKFDCVIVSDTLVEDPDFPNLSLGKPRNNEQALAMLHRLRGRRHRVWSASGIKFNAEWEFYVQCAIVEIKDFTNENLVKLIKNGSWKGKAGGYDIAGAMGEFAKIIEGDEICVLGFAPDAIKLILQKT